MKRDWKKHEKDLYLPPAQPVEVMVPGLGFYTLQGAGDPDGPVFETHVATLYAAAYGVRMMHKQGIVPPGHFEYTVYPLEGVWSFRSGAGKAADGTFNKADLAYTLMIRQPDFLAPPLAEEMLERTRRRKPDCAWDLVHYERLEEGRCVQMLHAGSYAEEPASLLRMEEFTERSGLKRRSMVHREIYLSDARKVAPPKLRTVLRFQVE